MDRPRHPEPLEKLVSAYEALLSEEAVSIMERRWSEVLSLQPGKAALAAKLGQCLSVTNQSSAPGAPLSGRIQALRERTRHHLEETEEAIRLNRQEFGELVTSVAGQQNIRRTYASREPNAPIRALHLA